MTKKLICVILCALLCLPLLSGCASGDAPDGMFSATIVGEPFILYVPNDWTDNRQSGISSAYFGLNVIVSARYYALEGEDATLEGFVDSYIEDCKAEHDDFSFTRKDAKLGKSTPAIRIEYDLAQSSGASAKIINYFGEHNGDAIMLSFYCQSSSFEDYAEVFEEIRAEFVVRDRVKVDDMEFDKNTPKNMKLASGDIQYSFYVPVNWMTNIADGFSSAYYDESGRPNVSVTVYSPSEQVDIDGYFALCEKDYEDTISGYEFISSKRAMVSDGSKILKDEDGYNATSFTYKALYGTTELRIMQTVFIYGDLVYSITYTAHADRFDAHLADVEAMLEAFRMN